MIRAWRVCLVALALSGGIKAETENASDASCEPLALLQHQADHDKGPCGEGVHLCWLRGEVKNAPDGTTIETKWENFRWERDHITNQLKVGSYSSIRQSRIGSIKHLLADYKSDLGLVLYARARKVEEMQKLKNLPDPWVSFFLELGLGALFGPVTGALGRSSLVENLNKAAAQDMMKYVISSAEKTVTKIGMDKMTEMMTGKFHESRATDFLDDIGVQFSYLSANLSSNLQKFTDEELYSLYVSYSPEVASKKHIEEMVDTAFKVWDTQVKGLGWHTASGFEEGHTPKGRYNYWEGIVRVDMDIVPDGGWLESHPKHSESWKKLKVHPYARVRREGAERLGKKEGDIAPPEFVAAVDEWTYPGLRDAGGHLHPKVPKSYVGIWSGPFFERKDCDGHCCERVDLCDCPQCKQSSLSVSFSEIFNLNKQGKKPGEECSSDDDCMTKACAWSGIDDSEKKRCCVDEDSYKGYGLEGWYCMNQPQGWPCDESVVCAGDLYCERSVCTKAGTKLKAGGLCHDDGSRCESGRCARVGHPNWEWQCCVKEDAYEHFGLNHWCTRQQNGYPCDIDDVCASKYCANIRPSGGSWGNMDRSCQNRGG